jgi:hypothetical protein
MIQEEKSKIHWNYFIAIEKDIENVSRYVEFSKKNFNVYSIELTHLLLAISSEVDVMAKLICKHFQPRRKFDNIREYSSILLRKIPELPKNEVFINRYGLSLKPWENWSKENSPAWWRGYNNVKHNRDTFFYEANLKNVLNAFGALLILNYHYYSYKLTPDGEKIYPKEVTRKLEPKTTFFTLPENYYNNTYIF